MRQIDSARSGFSRGPWHMLFRRPRKLHDDASDDSYSVRFDLLTSLGQRDLVIQAG